MHVLLPLLLLACQPPVDDTGTEAQPPDLPGAACGLAPYEALPVDDMGTVVDWERLDAYSFEADEIAGILEQAGTTVFQPVRYGVVVYRIRYVTQDRGERVEATGLISVPDVDEAADFPTALWLHPTMGFSDTCAPTAQGLVGAAANILVASQGFAVAAPDYLGMAGWGEPSGRLHPWIVPEPTAVASLDAARALWRFLDDREDPSLDAQATRRTVLWGASEGGFAALWSDRYAATYLPEAELVAGVAAVPPTDLVGIGQHGLSTLEAATAGLAGVLVASHAWYAQPEPLTEVFTSSLATELPTAMATECGTGSVFDDVQSVDDVFVPAFSEPMLQGDLDAVTPWSCYLERAALRDATLPRADAPFLFVVSEHDDLVVAEVERADAPRLCDAGYTLDYLECAGADHASGAVESLPYQLAWLRDRLDGVPLGETCVVGEPVDCTAL